MYMQNAIMRLLIRYRLRNKTLWPTFPAETHNFGPQKRLSSGNRPSAC